LQLDEAGLRHDGLAVDEVALERREHFLVGDLDRLEEGHAAQNEAVGWQDLLEISRRHGIK